MSATQSASTSGGCSCHFSPVRWRSTASERRSRRAGGLRSAASTLVERLGGIGQRVGHARLREVAGEIAAQLGDRPVERLHRERKRRGLVAPIRVEVPVRLVREAVEAQQLGAVARARDAQSRAARGPGSPVLDGEPHRPEREDVGVRHGRSVAGASPESGRHAALHRGAVEPAAEEGVDRGARGARRAHQRGRVDAQQRHVRACREHGARLVELRAQDRGEALGRQRARARSAPSQQRVLRCHHRAELRARPAAPGSAGRPAARAQGRARPSPRAPPLPRPALPPRDRGRAGAAPRARGSRAGSRRRARGRRRSGPGYRRPRAAASAARCRSAARPSPRSRIRAPSGKS